MKKIIYILLVLLLSCKNEQVTTDYSEAITFDGKEDFEAKLSNGMQIKIQKNTFETDSTITLKYISINNRQDFVREKVVTQTVSNQVLRTYGMLKIEFYDVNGKVLTPKKRYKIISKSNSEEVVDKIKIFHGELIKSGSVAWNEINDKPWKIQIYSNYHSSGIALDLMIDSGVFLTKYLDSKFSDFTFVDSIRCFVPLRLHTNGSVSLNDIVWKSNDRNIDFEEELKHQLKNILLQDKPLEEIIYIIQVKSFEESVDRENFRRSIIYSQRVGWFNFDEYIVAQDAYLEVESKSEVYIVSKTDDIFLEPYLVVGNIKKFKVPIEQSKQEVVLLRIENGKIKDEKVIMLSQAGRVKCKM